MSARTLAEFCLSTQVAPSEARHLTLMERQAFYDVLNEMRKRKR